MKKAVQFFNRGVVMGMEICALLAVLVFVLWGALLFRLSMGPLDASFLTKRLEASMNERQSGFVFSVGGTQLVWGGHFDLFQVEMKDVKVTRAGGAEVAYVRKMGVHLSKRHLVFGRLTPKMIRLYQPTMRVVRWQDGRVTLNFDEEPAAAFGPPRSPEMLSADAQAQKEMINGVLQELRHQTGIGILLGGLEEVAIRDARLTYDDRALGIVWPSSDANITVSRIRSGLVAKIDTAIQISPDRRMAFRAEGRHRWDKAESSITIQFAGVDPASIAAQSVPLSAWRQVSLPLEGSVALRLDSNFKPLRGRFILGAESGTFQGFGLYEEKPLPVASLYAKGRFGGDDTGLQVDSLSLDLGGPKISGRVALRKEEGRYHLAADAALTEMPMDRLGDYWPETLAPDPRQWVTTHLSKGTARKATLDLDLFYDPAAAEGTSPLEIKDLGGVIDFDGIRVDYFPPLMAVDDVRGQATYDEHAFQLAITGGKLGDMNVTKSQIAITDLAQSHAPDEHAKIDIAVSLTGPVKTALRVLDAKPLGYPQRLGIKSADVGGAADVDVSFAFPLHKNLALEEVSVEAKAKLNDLALPDMVAGMAVSGGPMDLALSKGALSVKGSGKLGDMPMMFDWVKRFKPGKGESDNSVDAQLTLDDAARRAFGVPAALGLSGPVPAKIVYRAQADGTAQLDLAADITPAAMRMDDIGFTKASGTAGTVSAKIELLNGAPRRIDGLSVETAGLILKGNVALDGNTVREAKFPSVMWGQTQAAIDIENRGAEKGYAVRISGRQFDAAPWLDDQKKTEGAPAAPKPPAAKGVPIQISMNVDTLRIGEGRALTGVKLFLRRNAWQRLEQLEMDGLTASKGDVYLRYMPGAGGPTLRFETSNAGETLGVFGVTRSIRGGKLVVRGEPVPKGGRRDMRGSVVLSDFVLRDAPVLALLLNSMSLSGVLDLLNGEGIAFGRARANFRLTDRGQPAQAEDVRLITLSDGRTSGASLGFNFEGDIDEVRDTLDLSGTIIPISGVNNVLSGIPLVGDILTGGGSGILAATYTVKGPQSKPQVSVNPLSVLAPGILRKIFFEN